MRIVFLCVDVPWMFSKASQWRHHQIIEALKENHTVKVIALSPKNIEEYKKNIKQMRNTLNVICLG